MSVEKEIRKILSEATPAASRAKQDLVRSGLGHDKNAAATMAALKDPEAAMQNPAKRELLLKVMQDLLDVVVNDPSMVMKTKTALRKEEVEEIEEKLIGGQKKLDKNKNGKLDSEDFKKLRNENLGQGEYDDPISRMRKKENEQKRKNQPMKENDCEMDDEEDEKKSKRGVKEGYVSHAQRKAVWASRNDEKEALKRKTKKEGLGEGIRAIHPSEIAGNPKAYDAADVKKAYYHKNASSDDKKALERHLDRHYGIRNWRKPVKEEVQIDEMNDYKVQVTHKDKDGNEGTMVHHLKGVKLRKAAGYIAMKRHGEMLKKKGIEAKSMSARIVESVTTNYDMIKGQSQNKAPTQKLATDYKLATKKTQKEEVQIDEAGPFSYGAKPPRKGSIAYNAAMKRKEQDKDPAEIARINKIGNKDHMVGTAKVIHKEETQANEAYNDYFARRKREEDIISGKKPARKKAPAQTSDYQKRRNKEKANEEVQIDEAFPTVADARKRAKEAMKSKFEKKKISTGTVYQKKHKDKEKEEKDEKGEMDEAVKADKNVPFDPPYSNKQIAIPGKQGIGVSSARHLARLALAKQLKNKNNK